MELPRIIIDQALFYIDTENKRFVETDDQRNMIPFAGMEKHGMYYNLIYDASTKNLGDPKAYPINEIPPFELFKIPDRLLKKGYLEGSEYADIFNERSYGKDVGILLVDSYMIKRLSGELPTVNIAASVYYVNIAGGELRGKGHSSTIPVSHFFEVDDHLLGFFQNGMPVSPNINSMVEIPEDLSIIEIPKMEVMDPIGYGLHHHRSWQRSLRKFSGEGAFFAGWGFPPSQTILSNIVRRNRESIDPVRTATQVRPASSGQVPEKDSSHKETQLPASLKEHSMSRIIIDQTLFGIDPIRQHLIEPQNPGNIISFAGLESEYLFAFKYDRKTRNIADDALFEQGFHKGSLYINIPAHLLRSGYREGSAEAYAFNLQSKREGNPVQVVDKTILDRFNGNLPLIEIAGKPYFIDIAKETFEACDKSNILHFNQFERWDGQLKGFIDIDSGKIPDTDKLTEIPAGLRLLEIPHPMILDPIGYAARHFESWAYMLNDNNIYEMNRALEIHPEETMLVKTIRKNRFVKKYHEDLKKRIYQRNQYKRKL